MENRIGYKVTEPNRELRALARMALKGLWGKAFLGVIIYEVLMSGIPNLITALIPSLQYTYTLSEGELTTSFSFSPVLYIYQLLLAGPIVLGYTMFILKIVRRKEVEHTTIFEGFNFFIKAFLLRFIVGILVMLWSMPGYLIMGIAAAISPLLVFVGAIAFIALFVWGYIRYSLATFFMADDTSLTPMECIKLSKETMVGNKAKYATLMLSFLGWIILALIPSGSMQQAIAVMNPIVAVIVDLILTIPRYFVLLYLVTTQAFFFEIATGRLRKEPQVTQWQQNPWEQNY